MYQECRCDGIESESLPRGNPVGLDFRYLSCFNVLILFLFHFFDAAPKSNL